MSTPRFDWSRVRWDDADAAVRNDCSLCGVAIPEDDVPLRMWNKRGDSCVFCDPCGEQCLLTMKGEGTWHATN